MSEIVLRKANVVKRVDSEDKAKALEAKGFVRTDGKTAPAATAEELRAKLIEAGEVIEAANTRKGELEKELSDAKEQLAEAEDRIRTLETELSGTKEQLEAAVKRNKEAARKEK